jgi:uncharacterized protein (DUF2062 family)
MLFRRREKATLGERFKVWLWPRVSWRRSALYYLKRILRLSGTPYAIAMGTAIGAFVACTPFVGFHLVITFALAWLVRGNMIAGAIGTGLGNPATFPLIWAGTYELGHFMLEGSSAGAPPRLGHDLLHKSFDQIVPLIQPMLIGSVPIGLAVGCVVYVIVYKAISAYRKARIARITGRRRASPAAADMSAMAGNGSGS